MYNNNTPTSEAAYGTTDVPVVLLTLLVALCSIVYELLYSQVLSAIYGQTVTRYALTIGLYLFSMGLGAFACAKFSAERSRPVFYLVEILLCIIGPAGVFAVLAINSSHYPPLLSDSGQTVVLWLCHIPIVLVGALSGMEVPLLATFLRGGLKRFYYVLGWDYFGSLLGAVGFALWLYPSFGLLSTALFIGFLNCLLATAAIFRRVKGSRRFAALTFVCLYFLVVMGHTQLANKTQKMFLEAGIVQRQWAMGNPLAAHEVEVLEVRRTPYQRIVQYRMQGNHCLDLDQSVQLCDEWVQPYHHALIDMAFSLAPLKSNLNILLLGGGDFVAYRYLEAYTNRIGRLDHVEIDEAFMRYARNDVWLSSLGNARAHFSQHAIHKQDAFAWLRHTSTLFDVVIYDLPGVRHDKTANLYTVEFFHLLRRHMKPHAVLSMWLYDKASNAAHRQVFASTLVAAGFSTAFYHNSIYERGYLGGPFGVFSVGPAIARSYGTVPESSLEYMQQVHARWPTPTWQSITVDKDVAPHSIFSPNFDIVVSSLRAARPEPRFFY